MGMADHIKRGESVFFPFRNGKTCPDSQNKPRMYKTVQAFDRHFTYRIDGVELVEYAEVVRCKDCKHRGDYHCPMYYDELIESDYDDYRECDLLEHDRTTDDGFCHMGERKNGD